MNRQHSFIDQIAEILAARDLQMFRSQDGTHFFGGVTTNDGIDLALRVTCPCNPSLVQVAATLPVAVPPSRQVSAVRVLNFINQSIPCGGLALDPDDGRVSLQNSAMIPDGDHPGAQLDWLLSVNATVMQRHARLLVRLAAGALGARSAIASIKGSSSCASLPPPPDPERLRWN